MGFNPSQAPSRENLAATPQAPANLRRSEDQPAKVLLHVWAPEPRFVSAIIPQRPVEAKPVEPAQQSAAVQIKPSDAQPEMPRQASLPVVEAKPAAQAIQPTQTMPKMQGLE